MNLENFNLNKKDTNLDKKLIEIEKESEILKELDATAKATGNNLIFYDYGFKNKLEIDEGLEVSPSILKNLNEEDKIYIKEIMSNFKDFIYGPVFTDEFIGNHVGRREWEKEYIENNKDISQKSRDYYKSNRMNANTAVGTTAQYLRDLVDIVNVPEIKHKIELLILKAPPEIYERYLNEDDEMIPKYYNLSNSEKIRVVEDLTEIIKEAIHALV